LNGFDNNRRLDALRPSGINIDDRTIPAVPGETE